MLIPILLLILGLVLLWIGSDFIIESAKKLAQRFRLSHVFIGLTVVSIGTSLPEIFTNVYAGISNLRGVAASGIAVGVNIGSSITQMTLVVGLVALISILKADKKTLSRDGVAILISILLVFLMGLTGFISRIMGIILILAYVVYLLFLSRDERRDRRKSPLLAEPVDAIELKSRRLRHHPFIVSLIMLGGVGLLILGGKFVVDNALRIADAFNLTQTFLGVIILGVGGCLPELSTALKGIVKKAHGISLGTLIGSNITNPLLSMGLGATIAGLSFNRSLLFFELPFWAFTVLVVMLLLRKNITVDHHEKKEGVILIGLYFLFVLMKIVFFRSV
ncbi:calcium/sodium antiporter [Candidatus Woesearchaeota archaeon]|nr:calcium/sodium antiporter [Candidatus Woesearchaeota archaeon]